MLAVVTLQPHCLISTHTHTCMAFQACKTAVWPFILIMCFSPFSFFPLFCGFLCHTRASATRCTFSKAWAHARQLNRIQADKYFQGFSGSFGSIFSLTLDNDTGSHARNKRSCKHYVKKKAPMLQSCNHNTKKETAG